MPPQKSEVKDNSTNEAETNPKNEEQEQESVEQTNNGEEEQEDATATGHKRKKSEADEEPHKAQKTAPSNDTKTIASPSQVLQFLLSDSSVDVVRPDDELQDLKVRGEDTVTYSSLLSPFEELLCAVVLSRPISHRLGLRTIRTILNAPYAFRTPEAITKAGSEKVHQALWDARTQHKDKTADEIELIADAISDNDWGNDLTKMREKANEKVEEEREILRKSVKGLGKTGLDIFYRRVQWHWEEAFPFIDERTKGAVEKLGLPAEPSKLVELIEKDWAALETKTDGEKGVEERKRKAFVLALERAVGADLEKKVEKIYEEAVKL